MGECHRYPPRIVDSVLQEQREKKVALVKAVWVASMVPTTSDEAICGEYRAK